MDLDQLTIRARVELLATDDGGRQTPLFGPVSYRPNHNFFGDDNRDMCMGEIELEEGQTLAPGEAVDVKMVLLAWPALTQDIQLGRRWRIQEGARLVGWGTVIDILGGQSRNVRYWAKHADGKAAGVTSDGLAVRPAGRLR